MRIISLKHQLNIRTTNELNEKCSENSSLQNQWTCIENQLGGYYLKIALTGNEWSITNNEMHGFLKWFSRY